MLSNIHLTSSPGQQSSAVLNGPVVVHCLLSAAQDYATYLFARVDNTLLCPRGPLHTLSHLEGVQVRHVCQWVKAQLADSLAGSRVTITQLHFAKAPCITVGKVTGGACRLAWPWAAVQQQLVEAGRPAACFVWSTAASTYQ
jgi:hypothetical protein